MLPNLHRHCYSPLCIPCPHSCALMLHKSCTSQLHQESFDTLQIFRLQKLQLLVVSFFQLQPGCNFCNYQLKLILVANFATTTCNYQWVLFQQPIVAATFGNPFCNRQLQLDWVFKISTNSCNNIFHFLTLFVKSNEHL